MGNTLHHHADISTQPGNSQRRRYIQAHVDMRVRAAASHSRRAGGRAGIAVRVVREMRSTNQRAFPPSFDLHHVVRVLCCAVLLDMHACSACVHRIPVLHCVVRLRVLPFTCSLARPAHLPLLSRPKWTRG